MIEDPINDATYQDLWMATAKRNTDIYDKVFSCIPNENIRSKFVLLNYFYELLYTYLPRDYINCMLMILIIFLITELH